MGVDVLPSVVMWAVLVFWKKRCGRIVCVVFRRQLVAEWEAYQRWQRERVALL